MKKEIIKIDGETLSGFTLYREGDFIEYDNQKYMYVTKHRVNGDGEWYRVVVKRESDGKFFAYDWGYGDTKDYYEDNLFEVEAKIKTKTTYE